MPIKAFTFIPTNLREWSAFFQKTSVTPDANSVTHGMLESSSGTSVIGRAAATAGTVGDIVASADNQYFGRRNGSLGAFALTAADLGFWPAYPASAATDAAIRTAASAANAAGGGRVILPAGNITLTAPLPLYDGVIYEGTGFGNSVDSGFHPTYGTRLVGNGTFPCFAYNSQGAGDKTTGSFDLGAALASTTAFLTAMRRGCGARNMAIQSFSYGVRVGGAYNPGIVDPVFEDLFIAECSEWGVWLENCTLGRIRNIHCFKNTIGQMMVAGSSGGSAIWNVGNTQFLYVLCQAGTAQYARNLCVWARAGSYINDLMFFGAQVNGTSLDISATGSWSAGNADITVPDASIWPVGLPVCATSNTSDFGKYAIYWVVYSSGTTIRLSTTKGGTAKVPSSPNSVTFASKGHPHLEIIGESPASVQPCNFQGVDLEANGTTVIYAQNAWGQYIQTNLTPDPSTTAQHFRMITGRTLSQSRIAFPYGYTLDLDSGSQLVIVDGIRREFGARANGGDNTGFGFGLVVDSSSAAQNPSGALYLTGNYQPDIYINKTSKSLVFQKQIQLLQTHLSGTQSVQTDGYYSSLVHQNAANDTWTLPAVTTSHAGQLLFLSNPQSANTLTVQTSSSQNIVGLGVSGTSITIAANSSALLMACNNNGTLFWARLA